MASADDALWRVSVKEDLVFNGDNVTITVAGMPSSYALLEMVGPDGNVTYDRFVSIGRGGMATVNLTLPYDLLGGTYTFRLVLGEEVVASCKKEIVYDEILALRNEIEEMRGEVDRNDALTSQFAQVAKEEAELRGMVVAIAGWSVGLMVLFCGVVFYVCLPAIHERYDKMKREDLTGINRAMFALTHRRPGALLYNRFPEVESEMQVLDEELREKEDVPPYEHDMIFLRKDGMPGGYERMDGHVIGLTELERRINMMLEKSKRNIRMRFRRLKVTEVADAE